MWITANLRLRDIFLNGMVEETTRLEKQLKKAYKYANPNLGFSLSCVLSHGDCANLFANSCNGANLIYVLIFSVLIFIVLFLLIVSLTYFSSYSSTLMDHQHLDLITIAVLEVGMKVEGNFWYIKLFAFSKMNLLINNCSQQHGWTPNASPTSSFISECPLHMKPFWHWLAKRIGASTFLCQNICGYWLNKHPL